MAALSE